MIAEGEAPVGSGREHDRHNSTRYPPPPLYSRLFGMRMGPTFCGTPAGRGISRKGH